MHVWKDRYIRSHVTPGLVALKFLAFIRSLIRDAMAAEFQLNFVLLLLWHH